MRGLESCHSDRRSFLQQLPPKFEAQKWSPDPFNLDGFAPNDHGHAEWQALIYGVGLWKRLNARRRSRQLTKTMGAALALNDWLSHLILLVFQDGHFKELSVLNANATKFQVPFKDLIKKELCMVLLEKWKVQNTHFYVCIRKMQVLLILLRIAGLFIYDLNHSNDLAIVVADRHADQGPGPVATSLILFPIKSWVLVDKVEIVSSALETIYHTLLTIIFFCNSIFTLLVCTLVSDIRCNTKFHFERKSSI